MNWNTCKICGKYLPAKLTICPVCRIKSNVEMPKVEKERKKRGRKPSQNKDK